MSFCMVVDCGSVYLRDVGMHFYRIPAETDNKGKRQELNIRRRQLWIMALRRDDLTELKLKYGRICSKHFISGKPAHIKDETNPDWVPSFNMGYRRKSETASAKKRINRYAKRLKKTEADDKLSEHSLESEMEHEEVPEQKDLTVENMQLALRSSNEQIILPNLENGNNLREKLCAKILETTTKLQNVDKNVLDDEVILQVESHLNTIDKLLELPSISRRTFWA